MLIAAVWRKAANSVFGTAHCVHIKQGVHWDLCLVQVFAQIQHVLSMLVYTFNMPLPHPTHPRLSNPELLQQLLLSYPLHQGPPALAFISTLSTPSIPEYIGYQQIFNQQTHFSTGIQIFYIWVLIIYRILQKQRPVLLLQISLIWMATWIASCCL